MKTSRTPTARRAVSRPPKARTLPKAPTGIAGLDEILLGGLPRGRPTLVCGSAGCGKTLFAMEFLLHGAEELGEPGVLISFEETEKDLAENVRSLGFDLDRLVAKKKIAVDHVRMEPQEIHEAGAFDLEGLFVRIGAAIDTVGAKRVVLDTIETLFGGFEDQGVLRGEIRRLFRWLKDRRVTAVVTGERGAGDLTRQGLEEYVSDCVILLDHRVLDQVSTRRLRVVKYRGTTHGTNEYPFLIDAEGIVVLPATEASLDHPASHERVSTGIPALDAMLGGKGFFRGSSVLLSGTAGSGKTTLAATFADAACRRGERCLYLAFDESRAQVVRNMRSVGLDLEQWIDAGLLRFEASRPRLYGLEVHLAHIHRVVVDLDPSVVIIDPVSNFGSAGTESDSQSMLLRLMDFLKARGTTTLLVALTEGESSARAATVGVTSMIDTWIHTRHIEVGGERNRGLCVLKSRGMAHSNQIREFLLTAHGIDVLDPYEGGGRVLTGSLRAAKKGRDTARRLARGQEAKRRRREMDVRRAAARAQIAALEAELAAAETEDGVLAHEETAREERLTKERVAAGRRRGADKRTVDGRTT